jgi:hypothetical protein
MNPIIEALSLVTPYDIDKPKVRIGPNGDGGYVFADDISSDQAVISYGISTEYRFDAEMARRGHKVYMFDHTIECVNISNDNMTFFKEGVAGVTKKSANLFSIEDHLAKYDIQGHQLILKMDVEGAEWDAINNTPDSVLDRFEQMTFEIHGFVHLGEDEFREKFVRMFRKINRLFTLFHVHANNHNGANGFDIVGGVPVSSLMEFTYIKTSSVRRSQSRTLYPTAYDYPCVGYKDKLLWFFPFMPTTASLADFALCENRTQLWTDLYNRGGAV